MIDQVRPRGLAAWIAAQPGGKAVVLDVREPWETQTASVKADGFELIVAPMMSVPQRMAEWDPATPIAVLCHHGNRSQRVALFLEQQGFEHLANIAGGIDAWSGELDAAVPRY